jgi:hypothetical protein
MSTIETRRIGVEESTPVHAFRNHASAVPGTGPRCDLLGIFFFVFHLGVSVYIILGWMIPSASALTFYLAFLPLIAMQWLVNRGSCVINNLESFLRSGRWRNPGHGGEGQFLSMVFAWWFGWRVRRGHFDAASYSALLILWGLGLLRLSVLGDPALLAIFP